MVTQLGAESAEIGKYSGFVGGNVPPPVCLAERDVHSAWYGGVCRGGDCLGDGKSYRPKENTEPSLRQGQAAQCANADHWDRDYIRPQIK